MTELNGRVYFIPEGGGVRDAEDVTDAVGALYDLCVGSMDFRSGFWTYEDAAPVARMAELMGYEERDEIAKYRDEQLHSMEASAFVRDWQQTNPVETVTSWGERRMWPRTGRDMYRLPHDHVFSTPGKCMWPGCTTTERDCK